MSVNFIDNILKSKFWWFWLLILIIAVNVLASIQHVRIDLTKEKRFSLSSSTKKILQHLEQPVQIDVYLTGDLSAGFKKLSIAGEELLNEFKEYGKGNLQFRFIKPGDGLPDSLRIQLYDSLVQMGIKPFNNQVSKKEGEEKTERLIFPSAMVIYENRKIAVDLMSGKSGMDEETTLNYSEALLEFKFADAIDKLTRKNIPIVAYAAGNGEPLPPNGTIKDLFVQLSNNYRFGVVNLATGNLDADTINALLVVKPKSSFTETEKLKIDQYVMNGGNVIWFIDKLYAEMDSLLRSQADFVAFDKNLNLDDILFRYGVRINTNLLQDLKCAKQPIVVSQLGGQPQIKRLPFPYYPLLSSPSDHVISKNLDDVLSIFPGTIDTVKAPGITKTILLASDTNSRTISTPALVSLQSVKSEEDFRFFTKSYLPVAVLLEGNFTSLYANRFTNELSDSLSMFSQKSFTAKSTKPSKQIIVSDADIVTNVVTQSQGPLPMGMQEFENYQFANREFLLNSVDYLVNPNGVLGARNKDFTIRLLDKSKIATQKTFWQLINILIPIFLVIVFGSIYQWKRKETFGK